MKTITIFLLPLILGSALSSCSRRATSAAQTADTRLAAASQISLADSSVINRRVTASLRQPRIAIVRPTVRGDTTLITIAADEIIVGDSLAVNSKTVVAASDSLSARATVTSRSAPVTSGASGAWPWMLATLGAIAALIVLSLRGTGSRR